MAASAERLDLRRVLVRVVVVSLVATAAAAIVALLAGDFGETEARIVLTTGAISFYGLLALPAGVLFEQGRLTQVATALTVAVAVAFCLLLYLIWIEWDDAGETAWKSAAIATTVTGMLSQSAAVLSRRRPDDSAAVENVGTASIVVGVVLAAMIVTAVLAEVDDDSYYRVLGAVAVLDVLLLVLPPVLRRGRRAPARAEGRTRLVVEVEGDVAGAIEREVERRGGRVVRREQA